MKKLVLLDNGEQVYTPSNSVILPVGVEVVREITLDDLSEEDLGMIRDNPHNKAKVNKILAKINESTSMKKER